MSFMIPDPREREVLHFHMARSLPYQTRIVIVAVMLVGGVALEVLLPLPWAYGGVFLLLAAGILMSSAGYSNTPPLRRGKGFWKSAPTKQLDTILDIIRKSQAWDVSALDISNGVGVLTAFGLLLLTGVIALVAEALVPGAFGLIAASSIALYGPTWFTGLRLAHTNKRIGLQVSVLKEVLSFYKDMTREDEAVEASLFLTGPEKNAVPQDMKLQFRWKDASPDFYGMQCQVNLISIQGKLFPYCYFVLVAKRELPIARLADDLDERGRVTVESKVQNDVNVIVIRQHTTKTSGYETNSITHHDLLKRGLAAGRRIASKYPKRD